MLLWSYVELDNLGRTNDLTKPFHDPPGTIHGTMNGLVGQRVPLYKCPSDIGVDLTNGVYQRTRGNYVVSWGNVTYGTGPGAGTLAMFAHESGQRWKPRKVRFADIKDGLSNSLMLSETLMALSPDDNDWRGDIHNDDGVFRFHTVNTPNSTAVDVVGNAVTTADPVAMPVSTTGAQHSAARSRHPGGVNVTMGDGTVRFYRDAIDLNSWRALGTISARDIPSE